MSKPIYTRLTIEYPPDFPLSNTDRDIFDAHVMERFPWSGFNIVGCDALLKMIHHQKNEDISAEFQNKFGELHGLGYENYNREFMDEFLVEVGKYLGGIKINIELNNPVTQEDQISKYFLDELLLKAKEVSSEVTLDLKHGEIVKITIKN